MEPHIFMVISAVVLLVIFTTWYLFCNISESLRRIATVLEAIDKREKDKHGEF